MTTTIHPVSEMLKNSIATECPRLSFTTKESNYLQEADLKIDLLVFKLSKKEMFAQIIEAKDARTCLLDSLRKYNANQKALSKPVSHPNIETNVVKNSLLITIIY